jgi:hypothetical protein
MSALQRPKPRFNAGDSVVVTGPGLYRDHKGYVTEVIEHAGDLVYRYRVSFPEGESATFFGFELQLES